MSSLRSRPPYSPPHCTQTKDEIEASREKREPSPWRDRPMAESLSLSLLKRRDLVTRMH